MPSYMCSNCFEYLKEYTEKCPICNTKIRPKLDRVSKTKLKNKAWKVFADYIKERDCKNGKGICYTCGKEFSIKDLQAGHLKCGRTNDILFDEDHVRIQCKTCNIFKSGNQGIFTIKMIEELVESGLTYEDAVNNINQYLTSKSNKELTNEYLCSIIKKYSNKKNRY